MKILTIDVSVSGCAVSVLDTAKNTYHTMDESMDRGQAERLIPMIEDILADNKIDIKSINRIAVTRGPGSFTGVRVGLSAARTLGMALNIPVLGFSTLEAILKDHPDNWVAIDTKRGDFYAQSVTTDPSIQTPDDITEKKAITDQKPNLETLARWASEIEEKDIQNYPADPIYLRDAETSQPKNNPPHNHLA